MKLLYLLVLFIFLISMSGLIDGSANIKSHMPKCGPSIEERLRNHFDGYEIRPELVINNNDDFGGVRSKRRTTTLANHKIVWITMATNKDVETSIRIDNETIPLKGKVSMNDAAGDRRIEMDLVNDWNQIKLYKLGNHEIIGITLTPLMCTGLMLSLIHI